MVEVALVGGIFFVGFVVWFFVFRSGLAGLAPFPDSVEDEHLRRVAELRLVGLSRGAIRLAREEGTRGGGPGGVPSGWAARGFWRRFAAVPALVEEDPAAALRELRGLSGVLEEALREEEGR